MRTKIKQFCKSSGGRFWPSFCLALLLTLGVQAGQGVAHSHDEVGSVPWSIHVIKLERGNPDYELNTTLGRGRAIALTTILDQLESFPKTLGQPIAAINGDFYRKNEPYVGDPKGLQVMRGELVSGPGEWACFYVDVEGNPHIALVTARYKATWPNGTSVEFSLNEERVRNKAVLFTPAIGNSTRTEGGRELVLERAGDGEWLPLRPSVTLKAKVREIATGGDTPIAPGTVVLSISSALAATLPPVEEGMLLEISTSMFPELKGVRTAIGGGPALVHQGKVLRPEDREKRHPRTAIGFNKEHIFLVQVDGRQRDHSVGMTLDELADYMLKIGCEEALNLDGGGSSAIWYKGRILNSPSEGGVRGMANGLVITLKPKK